MSMYAINQSAINQTAINRTAINRTATDRVTGHPVTGHPVTGPARPQLRLVGPPVRPPRRASSAVFWRRRLVVLLVFAAVVLAARALVGWSLTGLGVAAPPDVSISTAVPASHSTYVVQHGDTLWAIARSLQPRGDVRPTVDRLAAVRKGRPLQVGERLVLP
jgi:nucleoid-associated protein YgaU